MPFKSRAQMAKMAILEKEGQVKPGTVHNWAQETPGLDGNHTRSMESGKTGNQYNVTELPKHESNYAGQHGGGFRKSLGMK